MIIDFDLGGVPVSPHEADPPLFIDSDRTLSYSVFLERL
jgi:hypothetical protein